MRSAAVFTDDLPWKTERATFQDRRMTARQPHSYRPDDLRFYRECLSRWEDDGGAPAPRRERQHHGREQRPAQIISY